VPNRTFNELFQASEARDGVAKNLYEKLLFTIVHLVGKNLTQRIASNHEEGKREGHSLHIGIMDTLGFSNLEENGFEQLCINYVNEKLHNYYIHSLLISTRKIHEAHNIAIPMVDIQVNDDSLELFEKVCV